MYSIKLSTYLLSTASTFFFSNVLTHYYCYYYYTMYTLTLLFSLGHFLYPITIQMMTSDSQCNCNCTLVISQRARDSSVMCTSGLNTHDTGRGAVLLSCVSQWKAVFTLTRSSCYFTLCDPSCDLTGWPKRHTLARMSK